ncbi:class II fructose-bisphosphate aldolase [Brenneria uluponensis]|uniref:class II fructose-bisphosphate aldolase n=1 Tax=Brenneria uluponensis TaxID=3057057 RepID=UPI0028E42D3B|nr:class II fructose-bisphosphate aldolase [Brenneria ulupoensis]
MYAPMKAIIDDAYQRQYAVLAINCFNLETARAAIAAAEQQQAPLILNVYQGHCQHFPPHLAVPLVRALAQQAAVPIALSLDHGTAFDLIGQSFRAGFTGLMIDASSHPLAENIRQTHQVVQMAITAGVCVEGELGHIADAPVHDRDDAAVKMTQVEDVIPFIRQTGIDLLAVSVGTAHGIYPPGVTPQIDFERLEALHQASTVPLALHGGSGTKADDIRRVSRHGVAKINVGAAVFEAGKTMLQQTLQQHPETELVDVLTRMESACRDVVCEYLSWSGASNKA